MSSESRPPDVSAVSMSQHADVEVVLSAASPGRQRSIASPSASPVTGLAR